MIVYLSTIIIILILGRIYLNLEAKTQQSYIRQYIIAVSTLLILLSGLRNWAVGADTYAYYEIFEEVKSTTWSQIQDIVSNYYYYGIGKDPGYFVLQKAVQFFLPDYQTFLFFIAIIFFSALGNFIYRNTSRLSDAVLAYVLYCCLFLSFFSITGHRQTIATAASLYGYELIKRRKLIPFLLLILLASTVHKSVLVFIPFYFIAEIKRTEILFSITLLLFPFLLYYADITAPFLQYVTMSYDKYEHIEQLPINFTILMASIGIILLMRYNKLKLLKYKIYQHYNAFALAILFTSQIFAIHTYMRIVQYFSIFLLILYPAVINSFEFESERLRKMAFLISIYVLIALFINSNINSEYKFFWQEMPLGINY